MQQIAIPSIYAPRKAPVLTPAFPLVRRPTRAETAKVRPRRFVAGLLFGVLMSATLVLLGYEARLLSDQHPNLFRQTLEAAQNIRR
jgi:hypothetical protein